MTSLAHQSEAELGGPWSVLVRQKRDHERLDRLLHRLDDALPQEQPPVLREIYRLVFPHAFAEESVLWPVARRHLPDGEELTLRVEQEHQEVNELVTRLEDTPLDDAGRRPLVERLIEVLREDVRDEEDELLPRLQAVLDTVALRRLGVAWEAVRRVSPTRPHPVVSRRPPGNALAAAPLTVLDRTRDRAEQLAEQVAGRSPASGTALVRASHLLAGLAGRVEQVDVLRRGERPSTHRA